MTIERVFLQDLEFDTEIGLAASTTRQQGWAGISANQFNDDKEETTDEIQIISN
jgi:hypothetical protein